MNTLSPFIRSARGQRRNALAFALAATFFAAFLLLGVSNAHAFNVSNFTYTNSTTQAAGHPNFSLAFNRQGSESEDLKDVQIDLPPGVFANPESANPKCTNTQFNADGCPANSQAGTMTAGVKAMGLLDLTIQGSVDVITSAPNQVATLGMTLRPKKICILFVFCAQPAKIFLKTGITVRSYEDSGLRTYTPGVPRTATIGIPLIFWTPTIQGDITMNSLKLNFQARSGTPVGSGQPTGPYFATQTGSCLPATAKVTLVSYQNVNSSAASTFTPTGCPNVPFNPGMAFSVNNPNSNGSGKVTFTITIPEPDATIQNALPKIVDVDLPVGSGLDLVALSGVTNCTEEQLKQRACPASSIIGNASAISKYLPGINASTPGLVGNVYAMGVGNQIPIGVELIGPGQTVIIFRGTLGTRGDANAGTGRVYSTFDRIPQLPFGNFKLTIDKPVYKNPPTCGTKTVSAVMTGFNGTAATSGNGTQVTRTSTYSVVNCQTAPETTITSGPGAVTGDTTPSFSFTSNNASATFQCRVDAGTWVPCSSPYTTEPLSENSHTFEVKAVVGTVEDASPASATFTVDTTFSIAPTITVSTTQAVAHPNVNASFDITGGQPKQIALKLPNGFAASLSAVASCSNAAAAAGTCPATSKIGTTSLTVGTFSGAETGTGDLFLTEGPTGTDAGGVATNIQFSFGNLITQGGAYLVENGKNQYLDLRNIPNEVNGTPINATNLTVNLSGANSFLTNPSSCAASAWISTGTSQSGLSSQVFSVPFQATGCSTVTFNPTINLALSSPAAGTETGLTANLGFATGNSSAKTIRVNMPPTVAPNFPSFGASADQCPAAAAPSPTSIFDPSVCPAQAKVGNMTIDTPLLSYDLTGEVYLIEKSPIPWLGVKLDDPGIDVRLTGVTATPQVDPSCDPLTDPMGFCQTQISVLFNNLPDVQMSNINMVLDGPNRAGVNNSLSGKILKVAGATDPTCQDSTPASSLFIPYSGTPNITRTQNISISGCL